LSLCSLDVICCHDSFPFCGKEVKCDWVNITFLLWIIDGKKYVEVHWFYSVFLKISERCIREAENDVVDKGETILGQKHRIKLIMVCFYSSWVYSCCHVSLHDRKCYYFRLSSNSKENLSALSHGNSTETELCPALFLPLKKSCSFLQLHWKIVSVLAYMGVYNCKSLFMCEVMHIASEIPNQKYDSQTKRDSPLSQFKTIPPCPIAIHPCKQLFPLPFICSCQVLEGHEFSPRPSLHQAKQAQFPQPFLRGEVLQPSDHLSGPPLDPFQELHVFNKSTGY